MFRSVVGLYLLAAVVWLPPTARGAELISNGGFEAGLAGWTVTNLAGSDGTWFAMPVGRTPISDYPTVGPATGLLYALSDQNSPGTHALTQAFLVPFGSTSVILSYDMFVNDQSGLGPIVNPAGLDHTAGPNQHARVDLLTGLAAPFDTGAGVLANFYLGTYAGVFPHPYIGYLFDITALVVPGEVYQIRFAEVDNQFFFNQGVDNVSIAATVVPEPSTVLSFTAGLAGLLGIARSWPARRRAGL